MDLLDLDEIFGNDRLRGPIAPSPTPAPAPKLAPEAPQRKMSLHQPLGTMVELSAKPPRSDWWATHREEVGRLEDEAYKDLGLSGVSGLHPAVDRIAIAFNAAIDAHDIEAVRRAAAEFRAVVAAIRGTKPVVLSSSPCI